MSDHRKTHYSLKISKRTLPETLDDIAKETPGRRYATISVTANVTDGFRDVSFMDIANGANRIAFQLEKLFGRSNEFETITYLGIPDLRYVMVIFGAIKCGFKILLPSPRNPPATNLSLMATTNSKKLIYSPEIAPLFNAMNLANPNLVGFCISTFGDLILPGPHYSYVEEWSQAITKPIVVLHSSGSTGVPKPVIMTHGTFSVLDNEQNLPMVPGRDKQDLTMWSGKDSDSSKYHHIFPPFHLAGFVTSIVVPTFTQATPVLGPPTTPPSGHLISQVMKQQKLRGLFVPPSLAEALSQEPGGLDMIEQLDFICYAGGPLSQAIGDKLNHVTKLCQFYGSTEIISVQQLFPAKENWSYIEWNPEVKTRMDPVEEGIYELVVLTEQKGESALDFAFPGITEYATRDLFQRHPTQHGLWKFHSRRDDIIVLSNGEKFNPVPIESTLQGHVAGALVVGQGHFQAALIIEPKPGSDKTSLLETVWPVVQEANRLVPGQGRITRDMILLSSPEKPFVRAVKGTVIRKLTGKLYEEEIEQLYAKPQVPQIAEISLRSSFQLQDVKSFVRAVVNSGFPGAELEDDDDMYAAGLDSLRTVEITNALLLQLNAVRQPSELSWFDSRVLFNYPSINKLSQSLTEALETGSLKPTKDQSSEMNALISKYVENLLPRSDVVTPRTNQSDSTNLTVALIGTSGFLGTALLERLLSDARVSKIYGLTRGQASFTTVDSKIEYLRVDYTQPRLGLTEDDFNHLGSQCHMIILNAWKVNFNQTLQSFEDNIRSVKTAVEIVSQKGCNARLVFISSVSAVERYDITEMIPEAILGPEHGDIALSMGYSQSKLVAERILSEAATRCSIPITVLRVGQIAGSTDPNSKQEWPFTDAFPLIVAVAKLIGYLPRLRNIDWIPINNLVEVILELLHDNIVKKQCETYNLVNPRPITWSTLLRPLLNYCGPQSKVISGEEWLEKVKEVDFSGMMIRDLPLASVRETFTLFMHESEKHERKYEMSKALSASPALAKISPISEELLEIWIKQWNF